MEGRPPKMVSCPSCNTKRSPKTDCKQCALRSFLKEAKAVEKHAILQEWRLEDEKHASTAARAVTEHNPASNNAQSRSQGRAQPNIRAHTSLHVEHNPETQVWHSGLMEDKVIHKAEIPIHAPPGSQQAASSQDSSQPPQGKLNPVKIVVTDDTQQPSESRTIADGSIYDWDSKDLRILIMPDQYTGQANIAIAGLHPNLAVTVDIKVHQHTAPKAPVVFIPFKDFVELDKRVQKAVEKCGAENTLKILRILLARSQSEIPDQRS